MTESIKVRLLKLLEENRDNYISGAALAKELQVSRNAIWKSVESLRSEGYDISAITNKGYRLNKSGKTLSEAGIAGCLKTDGVFLVKVRKSVTSTNTILREMGAKGAPEGLVLVAEEQTAGKGRQGRGFYSPSGHGVYFSVLLHPTARTAGDAALITSAAAVAAARAIEETSGVHVGIKWVNDLFMDGKKVCGILTEATFGMESGLVENVVLGIGINVTKPENGFPETIKGIAAALAESTKVNDIERCRLIAATLDNFWEYYNNLAGRKFLEEYRARSIVLGRDIIILSGDEQKPAHAIAIDDDCRLVVRYENGETEALNSGSIQLRECSV